MNLPILTVTDPRHAVIRVEEVEVSFYFRDVDAAVAAWRHVVAHDSAEAVMRLSFWQLFNCRSEAEFAGLTADLELVPAPIDQDAARAFLEAQANRAELELGTFLFGASVPAEVFTHLNWLSLYRDKYQTFEWACWQTGQSFLALPEKTA